MKRLLWVVLLCVILAGPAGATVSDPNSTKGATCNGSATEFTYLFPAAATTDLSVYLITIATGALGEPLTLGVDYTATCSATGGTVTTTETYSSAYELWIERVTPKTQSLNLVAGGAFNPTLLVAAYDKLTKIVIELYNQQSKFIHVDSREQNVDLELPVPSVRANNYLTFDDDGNVSMTPSEADADVGLWAGVTPTTYFLTLPVAASASALQTLLGLGTIATQAANAVAITGGSVTGITDITVADGGTGASTAAGARINLDAAKKRWIDVTEYPYLATGDGTTDDGTAIAAAIAAAVASGGTVYFPTGVYRVTTDGILYHGETGNYGVSMVGDGPWNSQIYFDPITSDKWLWTHAEVSFVEQFAVFKDLGFFAYSYANSPGADPYYDTIANGFNLNWDANFYFQNCLFRGFERVFKTTGTTGGSGIRLNQCIISHIGEAVLHLDNAQSVDHTFTNCRLTTILGDVIYIDDGGGGQVTLDNCYVNMTNKSGDTDKHWIINGEAGDAVVGSTNNVFNFNELKLEPNSAYSCLFRTAQTNGTAWSYRINVNNSNIRSHTGADRLGVDIDLDTVVRFTNTNFGDWCTFDLTGDSDDICWVFLDKCSLYDGTSDYFTLNSYAGVVAENCTSWTQDSDNMIAFALLEGLTLTDRPMAIKNGDISAGYIDLYEDSDDGTSKMRLITPALAADKEYFMPAADGTDGQVLTTDGAGQWGFETVSGSGDMLASTYDADADGDIDVASGGTEKSTWTQYAIPYLSDTTTFGEIAIGTAGQYLKVSAGATGYEFGTIAGGGYVLADGSVPFASYVDVHATGVRITGDDDGALTLLGLGNGYDEDLTVNLDDTENTVVMSSSTGVTGITLSGIALTGNVTGALTGNADTATLATTVTITDNEDTAENNPLVFVAGGDLDGGNLGLESDGTAYYRPASGIITATGFAGTFTGALTGNATTATSATTATTATVATAVTITDNESDVENNPLVFVAGGDLDGGNLGLESDGTTYYTPSTGVITATGFAGALTGNVTGNVTGSSGSSTGNAATATALATGRAIGGVTFDGTAAITPTTIVVADTTDTTSYVGLWESATGSLLPKTDGGLTYNATTGMLTATGLTGPLTGTASTATVGTTVTITDNEDAVENNPLVFVAGGDLDGGNLGLESDGTTYYTPSTGVITATGFAGALTGAVTGNADTVTTNANLTGDVTSVGNATDITESVLLVGGTDTIFPTDPNADRVLGWDDANSVTAWWEFADVNNDAYNATTWNDNLDAPTKDAVRDALEALPGTGDMTKTIYDVSEDGFVDGNDVVYSSAWNSDVNSVAMNAIYDYLHQIDSDDDGSIIDEAAVTGAFEAELDNSAGLLAALSDETGTGVAVFGTAPTFTTSITITGADANPTAAGMIVYDSTVTGMSGGGLRWYDDNSIRILVDLETDATDDDYVVAYDAGADGFYMKADADTGGSTAYNSIGDPTGAGSISFDDGETGTYTGANDAAVSFITIQNSDADHTVGNMYLLDLDYSADDGDAEADFIKFQDSGSVVMTIQQDGEIATDGGITAGGTITATGSFIIGDADLAEVDMEKLDGITNGTAAANKAVVLDDNGSIAIIYSLTASTISDETLSIVGGEILDAVTLEATTTLGIEIGDTQQLVLTDGKLNPTTDNDIDLGDATHEFKDAFFDGTVTSDAFAGPLTGNVTGTADVATEVTVTDNEAEAENDLIPFVANAEAPGANALETDGDFYYTPNTGTVTATIFTAGTSVVTPLIDAAGDEDMDYGSADVDDHTFTSDGGTAILDGQITASAGSGNAAQTLLTLTNTDPASGSETSQTGKIVFNMTGSQNESTYVAKEAARIETYKISDWYASNTEDHDAGLKFYTTNNDTPAVRLTITNTGAATFASTVEASSLTEGGVAVHNNDQMDASSELLAIIDDETGTGVIMFNDSPTLADDVTINAAGVKITGSADGDMTWLGLGNGYDEDLNWNLDDVENTVTVSSTTGVTSLVLTSIALTADVTGALTGNANTATLASTVTYANNDATDENNAIVFLPGGDLDGGNLAPEVDGDFHYNPFTGTVTATEFVGGGVGITGVTAAHTGTIIWGGTAILETGEAFQFGDATDATLTHTYGNTGTNVSIAYSTGAMAVTGDLTATNLSGSNTGDNTTATAAAADTIDAITEIAAALKSGSDTTLVTGTKGTSAYISQWNADGDLVDGIALSTVGVSTGDTWTGDHDFGGADLELPQGQTPDTDGDVDLDFTDGKLVVQHGSAHAELSASTDVVMGSLIQSVGGTIISPDLVNDVFTVMPVNAIQFPHGITITAVWLQVASNTTYVLPVQNFDDFDTINVDNGTIDTVTYTADTTGEVTDTTPTYATIGPGQLVMISLPTTDVDWISFRIYYYEPIASP